MDVSNLGRAAPFTTKDGSEIREVAGRRGRVAGSDSLATQNVSLAEATVPVGGATDEHFHRTSEEIYLFTAGRGRVRVGDEERDVSEGDCVVLAPGVKHKLWCEGDEPLVLLCACAPPYSDDDTVMTGG